MAKHLCSKIIFHAHDHFFDFKKRPYFSGIRDLLDPRLKK